MTVKKKTFWLGMVVGSKRVGEIKIGDKLYVVGEEIPTDKIEKNRLSELRKAGSIGDAAFDVVGTVPDDAKDKDILLLQGCVTELMATAKIDGDTIAGLQLELEAGGGGDVAALKIQVAELEPECKRLSDDNEEKAALIKEQKAEIKALKTAGKTRKTGDQK